MKINKQIKVSGRVQGVFFRKSTQQKALELGIKGWVKNEPDGSVLVEMEGNLSAMMEMEEWLRNGPLLAKVEFLEISDGEVFNHADFLILR
ncbi:acylphosphatase [Aquiflexum gelatinilyticum]|uniref:Acylphosphatase n=1 Tax=Aquiflexum gelatinilyticum TaxID=2961943 RepID=A0A9X2P441_9BACT|nr:acylphosphatase [Aquiflexum gelatinilyticum]MCR9014326.1 acylphosphatase [Aquiflexum gelatinilyticum]